jgi:hypothetical protein
LVQRILPAWIAAEAEAVYDSGRVAWVEFILGLAGRVERHEDRLRRLVERAWRGSHTGSTPPSMDLPRTRAQRPAQARARARARAKAKAKAKAKVLMRREGERREAGG